MRVCVGGEGCAKRIGAERAGGLDKYPFGTAGSLSWRKPSIRSWRGGTGACMCVCGGGALVC